VYALLIAYLRFGEFHSDAEFHEDLNRTTSWLVFVIEIYVLVYAWLFLGLGLLAWKFSGHPIVMLAYWATVAAGLPLRILYARQDMIDGFTCIGGPIGDCLEDDWNRAHRPVWPRMFHDHTAVACAFAAGILVTLPFIVGVSRALLARQTP